MSLLLSVSAVLLVAPQAPPQPSPGKPIELPTEWVEGRFAVTPETTTGRKLRLFTDSAGGHFLNTHVVEELKLPTQSEGSENGREIRSAPYPDFKPRASIPAALGGKLYVIDAKETASALGGYDGMLGQPWFAGRVWTFDYAAKKLLWRAPGDLPKHKPENTEKLFFKTNALGHRQGNFARVIATIDGEKIGFLLDTGATDVLTDEALKAIGDGRPADRATSFLTENMYKKWRQKHPDWRVIEMRTKTGMAMIEVPKITIGGHTVGPVWFSVQQDRAFHQYMAQWMDKPTEGALGGTAFKYFRLSVDWPNAIAVFDKIR